MRSKSVFWFVCTITAIFMGAGPVSAQCDIALISDGAELDTTGFLDALDGMGVTYTVFNDNDLDVGGDVAYTDDPAFLASWNIIIWYQSGYNGSGRAITQEEHDAVAAWLAGGGRLVVTGYDVIGSPDDPLMAALIRSSSYGDYTSGYYSDVVMDHPITNGPYGNFVGQTDIEASYEDNDEAIEDAGQGSQTVLLVNYDPADNIAKILVTEDTGTGMVVVFWNGNYDNGDWDDPGSYPEVYDIMRNMIAFICQTTQPPADAIPVLNLWGATLLVLMLAGAGIILSMRK